jgi:oxygen-independent coproporphyrinogen-3 oxidase
LSPAGGPGAKIRVSADAEFSVEADPRVTRADHLQALAKFGFRRLSLGIQDFDPKVQDIVHRVQSEEQVRRVTELAREHGYTSVNYDLIYGLPLQTRDSVSQTVDTVRRLRPDRIAFYGYAHVPWIKPGQRRFTEADLPSGDDKRALYELGRERFEDVGYREVGMDHFALETDSLWTSSKSGKLHRNFMGYTSRQVAPLIGLGVSAIGDSWRAFAQNEKLLETYQARVEKGEIPLLRGHMLDEEDRILRRHILNLMTRFETSWDEAASYTPHLETIAERVQELARDGLLEISGPGGPSGRVCRVTEKGRPFLRNICMAFDARLVRQAPATQLFSKTI